MICYTHSYCYRVACFHIPVQSYSYFLERGGGNWGEWGLGNTCLLLPALPTKIMAGDGEKNAKSETALAPLSSFKL